MKYFIFLATCMLFSCKAGKDLSLLTELNITPRQEWGSQRPVLPMRTHIPVQITIHHTAVKQNPTRSLADKLRGLQQFSMERSSLSDGRIKEPWADIPYHFYIAVDGAVGEGRELKFIGDSNTPYDPTGHALIVLERNFNEETVTDKQYESLEKLIKVIARRYQIDPAKLSGHKDHATTGCPGTNLYSLIAGLKQSLVKQGL